MASGPSLLNKHYIALNDFRGLDLAGLVTGRSFDIVFRVRAIKFIQLVFV